MSGWRLSKYDPAWRDALGRYSKEEWTSAHDVGKRIGQHVLATEEYLGVERAYIETTIAFHSDAGSPPLVARDIERGGTAPNVPGDVVAHPPREGRPVERTDLATLIRSCLREIVWCRLEADDRSCMIHFGYDYYVYLTGPQVSAHTVALARAGRLFLEPCESPYLRSP